MVASVKLKAHSSATFKTEEDRQRFASFVSDILNAGLSREFTPVRLNESTSKSREWSVASNNDWWVFFDEKDTALVRIQHRYGILEALEPLAKYVAYAWRATIVQPEAVAA